MKSTIEIEKVSMKPITEREKVSMRLIIKKALAGVTAVATAAIVVPLMAAAPAFATPPNPQTGATLTPTSGIGSTPFDFNLPLGAACPGDSAGAGWNYTSYMVPASVNPSTLQFNSDGPVPADVGAAFRQPLFSTTGSPLVAGLTALADTAGGPGLILTVPTFNFDVFSPGDIPAGAYNIGIACISSAAPSATQLDNYWNKMITVSTNLTGGAAQISWAQGAVPSTPTLNSVSPGDGSLTATFTQPVGSDPAVTGFTATATPTVGAAVTVTGATSPIVIGGLTNGDTYAVTVRATNSVGNSALSNSISGTPSLTRQPVLSLVATPGTGTVDLSWTAPSDAATYPPTGYTVTNSPVGGSVIVVGTTAAASGLTAGTVYTFTVTPTYASGPAGMAATISATPLSAQVLLQDLTVNRPVGALVLTQVCGVNGEIPAETGATTGFPDGSLPVIPAAGPGTAPTESAGGSTADPRYAEGQYPYPQNADGTPNATYPTHCGINLGNATFVANGPGRGQFFAAKGVLNQVTIVDTRDTDAGWTVSGGMSRFVNQTDTTKTFAGSQLGWNPLMTDDSDPFTDSDGISYDQSVTAGGIANPNSVLGTGLGSGVTLGQAGAQAGASPNFTGGLGVAQLDARLKLLIPVTKRSGVYNGTLTITVT